MNNSSDPEIKKKGNLMSVIIKRGSKLPAKKSRPYTTVQDDQTSAQIVIYEGEYKYIKYNHILGEVIMTNLPKRKKGELNINIEFNANVNGILTVTATEDINGGSIEITIKNDAVGLTDKDIEKIRKKNAKLYEKKEKTTKGKDEKDYVELKSEIKFYEDKYNKLEDNDEESKYGLLINYISAFQDLIDSFDNENFDNETMIEKFYIHIRKLFELYTELLCMVKQLEPGVKNQIIGKIKKYINIFIRNSPLYLDDLVKIINETKEKNKNAFHEIIINIFEELKTCGKKCLKDNKQFCKYHSLFFFRKIISYLKEYIIDIDNIRKKDLKDKCSNFVKLSNDNIAGILSGACKFCDECFTEEKLIVSNNTGFTVGQNNIQLKNKEDNERNCIVLDNFSKILLELGDQNTIKKALCIANMIKIGYKFLGDINYEYYYDLGKKCINIIGDNNAEKCKKWYKEFIEIFEEIEKRIDELNKDNIKERVITKNQELFDEIEDKYNNCLHSLEFIKYILQKYPYKEYIEDKNINFSLDLLQHLESKYSPDQFKFIEDTEDTGNEKKELEFCIYEKINSYLKQMINLID